MGMSRPLRFIPESKTLVEVTTRTLQSRLLLRPSQELNEIVGGVLGRSQRLYEVEVIAFAFLSNHYHLLLRVDSAKQLADFMSYFNSNLAREVGRLYGWKDKVWGRRYRSIVVSQEEAAQIDRLKYVLAHGAKEGLVEHPRDWPGVHAVRALLEDEPIEGYWFDRTQENEARRRKKEFDRLRFATREVVTLSPLPCWEYLPAETLKERVADLIREIETEAAASRERSGLPPLGAAAIRKQHPHDCPAETKKSPAPLFHAFSQKVHKELRDAYHRFLGAFREAAERLRAGDRSALFPDGCFPPALPFVGS
jgi:REP element-mobilizing transposase RayT